MIETMKKYTFVVLASGYDAFLTQLREAGVVHITERGEAMADNAELQSILERVNDVERLMKQGAPDQLIRECNDIEQRMEATQREQSRMEVWGSFSQEQLAALRGAGYELHFYSCPVAKFQQEWGIALTQAKGRQYFVSLAVVENAEVVAETLNDKCSEELAKDVEALRALRVAAQTRIDAWWVANERKLQEELKELHRQIDWKRVSLSTDSVAEGTLRVLEGFCPQDQSQALNAKLDTLSCYYEVEKPRPEDDTPIKLKNNKFTSLFECLTGMYGWPNYGEFDPTPILGPFFLLFFSLCIGDAGYGLLLIIVGLLIAKGKLKIEMFDGMGPIIAALGVGSTIVGYLMGGFFGIDLFAAEWFPEWGKAIMFKSMGDVEGKIAGYDVMMVLALAIGVVHICLAMTIKCITYTRRFGWKENISAWGWLILILGGLLTAVLAMTGCVGPMATNIMLIVIGGISALAIFIFRQLGRNPLINIGAGLWDTYGMATGILGDVLSYIRLYALGLAGGMLGMAFNQLGGMVLGETPNVGTWVAFIVIVTFGHVLNLLMACLGAFVHPLRLTFVEYFKNSGYQGNGKLYKPFKK